MANLPLCIVTEPGDLQDGLFGNVFYHIFQILPYLHKNAIYPAWEIRTSEYGDPPDFLTIPGVLDLAYTPPQPPYRRVSLAELRRQRGMILGNDWKALHDIWTAYFTNPPRLMEKVKAALPEGRVLGVHYRGNDKLTTTDDSNPFTQQSFLTLLEEFLRKRSDFDLIFAATDEFSFVEKLRASTQLPVVNLGEVGFHKALHQTLSRREKADRALLDSLLLSRCRCVLETSSALPSFAKLFNPGLEIYRTAASKLFQDVPYFPVAFIPPFPAETAVSKQILASSMAGDWTSVPAMEKYKKTFVARTRKPLRKAALRLGYSLGADHWIRKLVDLRNRQIRTKLRRDNGA